MGLFQRKRDAVGLYRGDAPASMPGLNGEPPSAYRRSSSALQTPSAGYPTSSDYPTSPGYQTSSSAHPTSGYQQPPVYGGPPAGVMHSDSRQTNSVIGVFVTLIVVIVVGVMFVIGGMVDDDLPRADVVVTVQDVPAPEIDADIADPDIAHVSGLPDWLADAVLAEPGESVIVDTSDASFQLAVMWSEYQSGGSWGSTNSAAEHVIAAVEITRIDDAAGSASLAGWNWAVSAHDGEPVTGDLITQFRPALSDARLSAGETAQGFVSFPTSDDVTWIGVAGSIAEVDAAQAAWPLTPHTPGEVSADVGERVWAELGRPPFGVLIDDPTVLAAGDPLLVSEPTSGSFLTVRVAFAPLGGAQHGLGVVDASNFTFVADGTSTEVSPTAFALDGAASAFWVRAGEATDGYLAFDTGAASGDLLLRDAQDRVVIRWAVSAP